MRHVPEVTTTIGHWTQVSLMGEAQLCSPTRFTYLLLILNQHVRMSIYRSKSPSGLVTIKNPQQRQNAKDNTWITMNRHIKSLRMCEAVIRISIQGWRSLSSSAFCPSLLRWMGKKNRRIPTSKMTETIFCLLWDKNWTFPKQTMRNPVNWTRLPSTPWCWKKMNQKTS